MTTVRWIALVLVLAVLVPAEAAQAGGWATVELGRAPSGLVAGTPWRVELIVKQHGITPMEGVKPSIRIVNGAGVERTFAARPTGRAGHYVAEVSFPSAGTWRARIFDGFTDAVPHRIAALKVGAGSEAPGRFPWDQAIMIAIVALLFAGGWIAAGDGGRNRPTAQRSAPARRARPGSSTPASVS
jgi:hypothetical protein